MGQPPAKMKIAELARVTGVARSTIHHYRNLGLLPPCATLGPKLHLYGPQHVARLLEIKRLRKKGSALRELPSITEKPRRVAVRSKGPAHPRIVAHATQEFIKHGYERLRMDDIASALRISKPTIYKYFPSKQALFVQCVQSVRYAVIPEAARSSSALREATVHGRERTRALLDNFEVYRGLTRILLSLIHDANPEIANLARSELHAMVTNTEPFLKQQQHAGVLRPMDSELLAYLMWGALMGLGDRMLLDTRYSVDDVIALYFDVLEHGIFAKR